MVAEGAEVSGQTLAVPADVVAQTFAVDTLRAGLAAAVAKKAGGADCRGDTCRDEKGSDEQTVRKIDFKVHLLLHKLKGKSRNMNFPVVSLLALFALLSPPAGIMLMHLPKAFNLL